MRGFVDKYLSAKGFGFVCDEYGSERYFASAKLIVEDSVGRRFLIEGEEIEFDVEPDNKHSGELMAVSIKRLNCEQPAKETYHELVSITRWDGVVGFALRPSGDYLFIHKNEIVTEGLESMRAGTQLWCRVGRPSKPGAKWVGLGIEICMPEEMPHGAAQLNVLA